MKNQLTFAHVAGALLDNKIKTYPQHRLVRDLFLLCLSDEASDYGEASEDNITFSRWCNGARPVPVDILNEYKNDTGRNQMITDFKRIRNAMLICCQTFTTICPMYILHLKKLIKRSKPYTRHLR